MKTIKSGSKGNAVKVWQIIVGVYPDGVFGTKTERATKEFQRKHNLTVDGIVGDKTWEKLNGSSELKQSKRSINLIVVHCSATKEGLDYTTADIKKWHLARGFSDIGYHYVIYRDGSVHNGRDVNISGAHCDGHNSHSIGVCYIGGLSKSGKEVDTRTDAQKAALVKLLKTLKAMYPKATIHGHREYANKACPCFDAYKEYKDLK